MRKPAVTVLAETPVYNWPVSPSPPNGALNFTYICARYGVLSLAKRISRLMRDKFAPVRPWFQIAYQVAELRAPVPRKGAATAAQHTPGSVRDSPASPPCGCCGRDRKKSETYRAE